MSMVHHQYLATKADDKFCPKLQGVTQRWRFKGIGKNVSTLGHLAMEPIPNTAGVNGLLLTPSWGLGGEVTETGAILKYLKSEKKCKNGNYEISFALLWNLYTVRTWSTGSIQ